LLCSVVLPTETRQVEQAAEKAIHFVILNEVRNLSLVQTQEMKDSSARSAPRFTENVLREQNDKSLSFSASCEALSSGTPTVPYFFL